MNTATPAFAAPRGPLVAAKDLLAEATSRLASSVSMPAGVTPRRVKSAALKHADRSRIKALHRLGVRRAHHCAACRSDVADFFYYNGNPTWGCPVCRASGRERFVVAALDAGLLDLPREARILQVAPSEKNLFQRFQAGAQELVTGDLHPELYAAVDARHVDLMDFRDHGCFDRIYASHVLEHVPDDRTVLANIHAQLHPGGEVWLLVPQDDEPATREAWPGMTAKDREREFGQWDHVRQYGRDFGDRIAAAGFEVEVIASGDLSAAERARLGITVDERIYVGRKQVARALSAAPLALAA